MTLQDSPKQQSAHEDVQGLPLQLKILLVVITVGIVGLILKATGVV